MLVPQRVTDLLAAAFPGEAIGAFEGTFGGYSNLTFKLTVGTRQLVAKVAESTLKQADVHREAALLDMLRASELPIPVLVALLEDSELTVELLGHIEGTNGLHYFGTETTELPTLFAAVGRVLAEVHQRVPSAASTELALAPRYRQTLHELPMLGLEPSLRDTLVASLEDAVWSPTELRLVHGDPGLHNLLWNGELTALLDWEWSGWGNPLLDVAWIYWITRLRNLPPELWTAFQSAYGSWPSVVAPTSQTLRSLVLGHIAFILVRARHLPTWQEWQRRATWTAALEFPNL